MDIPSYWGKKKKKKDFADVIKSKILWWGDYPGFSGWALNAITYLLMRHRAIHNSHREVDMKKDQREIWIYCPWRMEQCGPNQKKTWEFGRGKVGFSPRHFGENVSLLTPWFHSMIMTCGFLAFSTMHELISVIWRHQMCDHLLQQLQETNTYRMVKE